MSEMSKYPGKLVFGLDIGTRSIVGTVGYKVGEKFIVVAQRIKEHETRAMLDGQIHDIGRVGETILDVKTQLEEAVGTPLTEVCIAAAGRVLRTVTTHIDYEFSRDKEVNEEDIMGLDSMGVEKAYEEFQKDNDSDMKFYCVGYTVIRYYLNGYPITNLQGHKAKSIAADLIATFLPDDVVDGLYKAVGLAGLEVANLTLEPIAAIRVAIPEMYRMLNIGLVDVGAGTSDISITKDGSVIAYGMVPTAGDSITEALAQYCLVDFNTAEGIKRDMCVQDKVSFSDIMGLVQTVSSEDLYVVTKPYVDSMAKQAADKIRELNGDRAVSAVFVVGGGGKIKGYTESLAAELGIQVERVALRGEEVMQKIEFLEKAVKKDSLIVTPVGICLSFYEQNNNFIFVTFNKERIKIYDNNKLAVVDVAMQADFPNDALFPKRGRELNFTVNGKSRIQRGLPGEAAVISVNGELSDIHTPIKANDVIIVKESTAGDDASLEVSKLPEFVDSIVINVNEQQVTLPKFPSVNGTLQSGFYMIQEGDDISFLNYYTVKQVVEFMDVILDSHMNIYVNNALADMDTKVYENFSLIWTMETLKVPERTTAEDICLDGTASESTDSEESVSESVTSEQMKTEPPKAENLEIGVIVNGAPIILKGKKEYVYVDIFDYIDFDLSRPQGGGIVTLLNGSPAQYMANLNHGDKIDIYWRE